MIRPSSEAVPVIVGRQCAVSPCGGFGLSGKGHHAILDNTRTMTLLLRTSDDPTPDTFVMRRDS